MNNVEGGLRLLILEEIREVLKFVPRRADYNLNLDDFAGAIEMRAREILADKQSEVKKY